MSPINKLAKWTHTTPTAIAILALILGMFSVTSVVLGISEHFRLNRQVQRIETISDANARVAAQNRRLINVTAGNTERIFDLRKLQIDALKSSYRSACRRANRSDAILGGLVATSVALLEDPTYVTPGLSDAQRAQFVRDYKRALKALRPRNCDKLVVPGTIEPPSFKRLPATPVRPPRTATATAPRPQTATAPPERRHHHPSPPVPSPKPPPPVPSPKPPPPAPTPPPPPPSGPPPPAPRPNPLAPLTEPLRDLVCRLLPGVCR